MIPAFLNTGFRMKERIGVDDVQSIIDDFEAEVSVADDEASGWLAWTDLGGGWWRSPSDEYDRHFDMMLTRVTQQKLQIDVNDQFGDLLCQRRINCVAGNTWLTRVFTGTFHFVVDVMMYSAAAEALSAGVLDMSPDRADAHQVYCYGGGSRSIADGAATNSWRYAFMMDGTSPAVVARATGFSSSSATSTGRMTLGGARVFRPREFWAQLPGNSGMYGYYHYAGKCCQQLLCPANLAPGAKIMVPLDAGVMGEFTVASGITGDNATSAWRLCVRSA